MLVPSISFEATRRRDQLPSELVDWIGLQLFAKVEAEPHSQRVLPHTRPTNKASNGIMARRATIEINIAAISNQTTTAASKILMATSSTLQSFHQYNKTVAALGMPAGDSYSHSDSAISKWAKEFCKQTSNLSHPNTNSANGSNYIVSGGNDDDDEQLYVKLSTFWYCFFAFITTVGLFVSLVSNMIIIYLFTGTPSLRRNPSNIIAVNLSLSDLLYCFQWPSVIYSSLSQSTWMLKIDFVCKTFGFITVTTASASVLTVLAMSVERAIVIKYSIYAKSRYTIRSAWFIVVLIWIVSIGSSLPPLFDKFNRFTLDPSKTSCTLDYLSGKTNFKLYMLCIYIMYWILPATIITICYIFIIMAFKRSSKSLRQVTAPDLSSSPASLARSELASSQTQTTNALGIESGSPHVWRSFSRNRLRDSIRLSNFLGTLKRSSTTRLGTRQDIKRFSCGSLVTNTTQTVNMTETELADSNRMQTPGRHCRVLKRVASSMGEGKLNRLVTTQSGSDQALERIELAQITGSWQATRPGGTITVNRADQTLEGLDSSEMVRDQQPRDELDMSDKRQASSLNDSTTSHCLLTKINPMCDPNEPSALKRQSSRRQCSRKLATLNNHQVETPSTPASDQQNSTSQTTMTRQQTSDGLQELTICRPAMDQRPHVFDHLSKPVVGSGNANFKPCPPSTATGTVGLAWRVRQAKLAIISRVMSQLSRVDATTTVDQTVKTSESSPPQPQPPPPQPIRASCSKINPTPSVETSCHFGNSSSQSSRARMQIRLAKMSFYLILLWLISWTPIASLTLINLIAKCHVRANALLVFLANTMTKLGPTFDVFIYGISHPRIKKKFIQIIKRLLMLKDSDRNGPGATNNSVATLHQRSFHSTQMTLNGDKLSTRATRGANLEALLRNKTVHNHYQRPKLWRG